MIAGYEKASAKALEQLTELVCYTSKDYRDKEVRERENMLKLMTIVITIKKLSTPTTIRMAIYILQIYI